MNVKYTNYYMLTWQWRIRISRWKGADSVGRGDGKLTPNEAIFSGIRKITLGNLWWSEFSGDAEVVIIFRLRLEGRGFKDIQLKFSWAACRFQFKFQLQDKYFKSTCIPQYMPGMFLPAKLYPGFILPMIFVRQTMP